MSKYAGYLQGNLEHHLDHLAPFCSLMGWPLIVTDEEIYKLGISYYPDLDVHLLSSLEAPFEVTKQFDTIVTTLPRIAFDEIFFIAEASLQRRLKTFWLPHGNSDKGGLEALASEEAAFVYGPKMIDLIKSKNVNIPKLIRVGNFRYIYYQKHRQFYENLLDEIGLKKSFILYAPTWKDAENSSSFEMAIDALTESYSLVIKPHPNELEDIRVIQRKLINRGVWLDHFPPIYPLLERTTHLIGDFSSIGYDFLRYNRPMFFFNPSNRSEKDPGRFLHEYGTELSLPIKLKVANHPSDKIKSLKTYTFGEESRWSELIAKVKQLDT
jgi:teichoic acid glycerol-phosphate primase